MITVKVDTQDLLAEIGELKTMGELIELIKASIDPDSIITSISLGGNPLSESDWRVPLSVHSQSTLEVTTGSKEGYMRERLALAGDYLSQIIDEFRDASAKYLAGNSTDANTVLSGAVDDLLAFVNWYLALLSVEAESLEPTIVEFERRMSEIRDVCEQLLQQQMFQSWQALGEILQNKLEPELNKLKVFCEDTQVQVTGVNS